MFCAGPYCFEMAENKGTTVDTFRESEVTAFSASTLSQMHATE